MAFAARQGFAVHCILAALILVLSAIAPAAAQVVPARSEGPAWQTQVRQDALNGDDRRTRFVIGLDREAKYSFLTLPNRVVIELPDIRMQLPAPTASPVGLVTGFTGGLAGPGRSRVVIDVAQPVAIENARMERTGDKAWRLAFDMVPAETATKPETKTRTLPRPSALGAAGVEPPQPRPAVTRNAATSKTFKPTIVIDPGHGGPDAGAQAKTGDEEKEVVLDVGKRLRDQLLKTNRYRVIMTRDDDYYVPLDERVAIARTNGAALFISIHADSLSKGAGEASGATIYTLSERASDPDAQKLADKENDSDKLAGYLARQPDDIANILFDLAQRNTKNHSALFARTLAGSIKGAARLHKSPLRSAGFVVLKSPDVPSVLLELGYLSSPEDLKQMTSETWREKVSAAVVAAIDKFFADRTPAVAGR